MAWAFFGFVLLVLFFGLWAIELLPAESDERSIRRYERQKAEFERWFK